ncbi:GvpL/GvpF family gas vesicle protein [Ralstonia chuxiongensis]|uniref:GvpL/GvpF family gas vesicle protein n=1 Tax=Ralstonia chuxiongensis TaxID=2957504 RepID=UPI0028F5E04A|nr:GvpL/GvpF family gas vesicle protein [Ralstonia chuxiongensis]CAJ0779918.1 hypothetical protein R8510_04677 [Ralstonia chuxiongensis]
MTQRFALGGARYLYAIAPSKRPLAHLPHGIGGAPVHTLAVGSVAAVVSDTMLPKIRPERRHLSAHHAVVQSLMQAGTVLPVAFGMIATSEGALSRMLKKHQETLGAELDRLAGQAEFEVRLAWDVPNIFEHIVHLHPELKAARDEVMALGRPASRDEKIELGCLFERLLDEERARHTALVEAVLRQCCNDVTYGATRHTTEIARLACLAPSDARAALDACVTEVSSQLDDSFVLSFNGPWPPHHFLSLNISV